MDNLLDIRHHANAMEVASSHREQLATRRAAGFFNLYEAVLMKESDASISTKGKGKRKASIVQQSENVRIEAADELLRYYELPSQKWTWGTELSREEVVNLIKPPIPSLALPHSGYDFVLPEGQLPDESSGPASPQVGQEVSEIASDIQSVPDLQTNHYPTHFCLHPLRQDLGDPPLSINLPRYNISGAVATHAFGKGQILYDKLLLIY